MGSFKMQEQLTQKAADSAAAGSAFFAGAAWIADVEPYLTAGAAFVAIVAGVVATWYHAERALSLRAQRKAVEAARQTSRGGDIGSKTPRK
jgi:hypothetical protein